MARALGMLLMVFCIEVFLYFFVGKTGITSLFNLALNIVNWSDLSFFAAVNTVLGSFAGVGIIAGLYFIRNDFVVYLSLIAVTITFGADIYELYQFLYANIPFAGGEQIISLAICGPLAIAYIWIMLSYAGGKDNN